MRNVFRLLAAGIGCGIAAMSQAAEPPPLLEGVTKLEVVLLIGGPPPHDRLAFLCDMANATLACHARVYDPPAPASTDTEYKFTATISGNTAQGNGYAKMTTRGPTCRLIVIEFNNTATYTFAPGGTLSIHDGVTSARFTASQGCPTVHVGDTYEVPARDWKGTWRILAGGSVAAQMQTQTQDNRPAPPAADNQRIMVVGDDGKIHILTPEQAAKATEAPRFVVPSLTSEFESLASTPILISPVQSYVAGQIVLPPLPVPPGYKSKFELAYEWAENRAIAEVNWAMENKAQAAIAALSLAVSLALPELPAVAALGPLGSSLVSGLTAPILATGTTTFVNTFMSTGRTDKAALAAAKDAGVLILKAAPSAYAGHFTKTVFTQVAAPEIVTSIAEKTAETAADLTVQYAPAILSQPIPVSQQSTVSFTPRAAR